MTMKRNNEYVHTMDIITSRKIPMQVRLLMPGARYGLTGSAFVSGLNGPLVEFYDLRYSDDHAGVSGQFTGARYEASTIFHIGPGVGLDLMGGEPDWQVDGRALMVIRNWLELVMYRDEQI